MGCICSDETTTRSANWLLHQSILYGYVIKEDKLDTLFDGLF